MSSWLHGMDYGISDFDWLIKDGEKLPDDQPVLELIDLLNNCIDNTLH